MQDSVWELSTVQSRYSNIGSAMKKIDNHKIPPLLFQPVGHIKVFFYIPINLIYLSPHNRNRD